MLLRVSLEELFLFFFLPDVEIKLDEDGFVLPFTVDEDVHKR